MSAALAFHTILAVVPVLGFGFWYLHRLGVTKRWVLMTQQYVFERLSVDSSAEIINVLNNMTLNLDDMSWGWVGFSILLYTAISLVAKFGRGLDSVMGEHSELQAELRRNWIQRLKIWLRRSLGILGLPVALTISVGVSQWIKHDSWLNHLIKLKHLGPIVGIPLSWGASITSVFFVYYFIPSRRVGFKAAFKLALVVGPLLELIRLLLGLYAKMAVAGQKVYGVFAIIPMLILLIQLSWAVLLSGAVWLRTISRK